MPLDPTKVQQATVAMGATGKSELVGPDTVNGVATMKYKMTSPDNKVYWFWVDPVAKVPVKMAADDGSVTVVWKDYKPGPQDASLFEPPADYQVMQMPSAAGGAPASAPT